MQQQYFYVTYHLLTTRQWQTTQAQFQRVIGIVVFKCLKEVTLIHLGWVHLQWSLLIPVISPVDWRQRHVRDEEDNLGSISISSISISSVCRSVMRRETEREIVITVQTQTVMLVLLQQLRRVTRAALVNGASASSPSPADDAFVNEFIFIYSLDWRRISLALCSVRLK